VNRLRITLIATGCATALAVGGVAPAFATDGPPTPEPSHSAASIGTVQQRGEAAIDKRVASLKAADIRVTDAKGLSSGDRSTILSTVTADLDGLAALRAKLAADTDVVSARADVKDIYTKFRVYAVAIPQSSIAIRADRISSTTSKRLQSEHDRLADRGADKTKLAAMQTDIDAANKDVEGLDAAALRVTPATYDSDHSVMTALRARSNDASSHEKDAAGIGRELGGAHRSHASSSTPSPSTTS
jgi:hypothetical protein